MRIPPLSQRKRRHPEVRAFFGEPRRMDVHAAHPSRRAKSAHLRMTIACVAAASIVEPGGASFGLDVAAALLAFEPALFRAEGRLGCATWDRAHHGLAQQFEQAVD